MRTKKSTAPYWFDVIEHVPDPASALRECRRISKFTLLKIPLEDTLLNRFLDIKSGGKFRQETIERNGHIHIYTIHKALREIEMNLGRVLTYYYMDAFSYFWKSEFYRKKMTTKDKLVNLVGRLIFKISPKLNSYLLGDSVVVLVESNQTHD